MRSVLVCTVLSLAFIAPVSADESGASRPFQIATLIAPPAPPPPPPPPSSAELYIVFFGPKGTELSAESEAAIAHAAEAFKTTGAVSINVVGHADATGSPARNQALSERRAERVKASLVAAGVPADAVATSGRGSSEPMVPAEPGVPEPQNRRATIELVMPTAQ